MQASTLHTTTAPFPSGQGGGCCIGCVTEARCDPVVVTQVVSNNGIPMVMAPRTPAPLPGVPGLGPAAFTPLVTETPGVGDLQNELKIPTVRFAGLELADAAAEVANALGPNVEVLGFSGLAKTMWGPNRMQVLLTTRTTPLTLTNTWNAYGARSHVKYLVLDDRPCLGAINAVTGAHQPGCVAGFTIEVAGDGWRTAEGASTS